MWQKRWFSIANRFFPSGWLGSDQAGSSWKLDHADVLGSIPLPAVISERLFYQIFSSHFSGWSFFFLMIKIILISLKRDFYLSRDQLKKKWWWWRLENRWLAWLVSEICFGSWTLQIVTFCAAYAPCQKGSVVDFCASAASAFSIFLAVLAWNCKVTQPVFFASCRWSFTGVRGLPAAGELSPAVRPWIPCWAPAHGWSLLWPGRVQSDISPAQVCIPTGLASLVINTCSKKLSMSGTGKIIVSFNFISI